MNEAWRKSIEELKELLDSRTDLKAVLEISLQKAGEEGLTTIGAFYGFAERSDV
jgi:hypothetical protein